MKKTMQTLFFGSLPLALASVAACDGGPARLEGPGANMSEPVYVSHDLEGAPWLSGASGDPLRVALTETRDETVWTLTVSDTGVLHVQPRTGEVVTISGHPLRAEFQDEARLLSVTEGPEGPTRQIHYFVDPVRWWTSTAPAAAPSTAVVTPAQR